MNQPLANRTPLDAGQSVAAAERAEGIVQRVDTVGRELKVLLSTGVAVVDVPLDCPVMLRGERIKLRMVQPGDEVRIMYSRGRGRIIGKLVEVQPDRCRSSLSP